MIHREVKKNLNKQALLGFLPQFINMRVYPLSAHIFIVVYASWVLRIKIEISLVSEVPGGVKL